MVVIFEWMVSGVLVFLVGSFMGAIYDISGYDNIYLTYRGMTGYNHTVYSNDFLSVKWIHIVVSSCLFSAQLRERRN